MMPIALPTHTPGLSSSEKRSLHTTVRRLDARLREGQAARAAVSSLKRRLGQLGFEVATRHELVPTRRLVPAPHLRERPAPPPRPVCEPVDYDALSSGQCRMQVSFGHGGEPLACGAPVEDGDAFCPHHKLKAQRHAH